MIVYPVKSSVNGARIAVHKTFEGAMALAGAVNKRAGDPVLVNMGEALDTEWTGRGHLTVDGVVLPVNPPMGGKSDPHGWVLDKLVENARAPRARARKATAAKTTAATGKASKPTAGRTTAAKTTAAKTTRTRVKAGAAA